jgi:hypothetical protein
LPVGDHRDRHFRVSRRRRGRLGHGGAALAQRLCLRAVAVPDDELVTMIEEPARDPAPHRAEPDHSDAHAGYAARSTPSSRRQFASSARSATSASPSAEANGASASAAAAARACS